MGLVLLEMTSAIQKKHESKIHLNVDYEFSLFNTRRSGPDYAADVAPGPDYAADVAVIVINIVGIRRPVIMYEYKPKVPTSPEDIHLPHLCEVLLQGYYCVKHYTPVLHCLTDLTDWHYLMLEHDRENDCLDIKWTCSFEAENLSQEHLNFLYRAVKPVLDSIAIKHGLDGTSTSS